MLHCVLAFSKMHKSEKEIKMKKLFQTCSAATALSIIAMTLSPAFAYTEKAASDYISANKSRSSAMQICASSNPGSQSISVSKVFWHGRKYWKCEASPGDSGSN
jgi:hypothetical protein